MAETLGFKRTPSPFLLEAEQWVGGVFRYVPLIVPLEAPRRGRRGRRGRRADAAASWLIGWLTFPHADEPACSRISTGDHLALRDQADVGQRHVWRGPSRRPRPDPPCARLKAQSDKALRMADMLSTARNRCGR